jgi:carboxylate-amine ligase
MKMINEKLDKDDYKRLSRQEYWIAPENQWSAARDGIEGEVISVLDGKKKRIADAIIELIDVLSPIAHQLDCYEELQYNLEILRMGNGATRQRRIFEETGSYNEVVKQMRLAFQKSLEIFSESSKQ